MRLVSIVVVVVGRLIYESTAKETNSADGVGNAQDSSLYHAMDASKNRNGIIRIINELEYFDRRSKKKI